MEVVYLDGLPYPDPDYLRERIAAKEAEAERWRARARQHEGRRDPDGRALVHAYLSHARVAEMDAARRRDILAEMRSKRPKPPRGGLRSALAIPRGFLTVEAYA